MWKLLVTPSVANRTELAFDRDEIMIGSYEECDVRLTDVRVAPRHARVVRHRGAYFLVDHGAGETYVNGERLTTARLLRATDVIQIGVTQLRLEIGGDEPLPPPAHVYDPVEESLMQAIVDGDPDSEAVYADWLEERGESVRAEYLRLRAKLDDEGPTPEAVARFAEVRNAVDVAWERRVERPPTRPTPERLDPP